MKTYPYIGQCYSAIILFYAEDEGLVLDDALGLDENIKVGDKVTLNDGTNITTEYLQNTYGEVQSPEHAEFIIELCLENSISFAADNARRKYFSINSGKLYFFCAEIDASNIGSKLITIPLPPKAEPLKNAGDNLVLGCEDSKCDEWSPKVGGEVLTGDDNKGIMIVSKPDDHNMVVVECKSHDYGKFYRVVKLSDLSKPKTPEEELFDAFWREVGLFMNQSNLNKGIFKAAFINNITKKPQ